MYISNNTGGDDAWTITQAPPQSRKYVWVTDTTNSVNSINIPAMTEPVTIKSLNTFYGAQQNIAYHINDGAMRAFHDQNDYVNLQYFDGTKWLSVQ
jgi:hypothetical protein